MGRMASDSATECTRVTLLTKPHCELCDDAKGVLSRLAVEYPLAIETVDLDSPNGEQLAMHGGILFPPGIFLDGEPFSYGRLSERKLRRELDRRSLKQVVLSIRQTGPVRTTTSSAGGEHTQSEHTQTERTILR